MPKITGIEIFKTDLPFKHSFKHSIKIRNSSESVFLKVILDNGILGFGECLPREYVTGNTHNSVFREIVAFARDLIGFNMGQEKESLTRIKDLQGVEGEARCAVEMALLDCLGRACSKPLSGLLGDVISTKFTYSFVIPSVSLPKTAVICVFAGLSGYRFIKLKVGAIDDMSRVRLCRNLLSGADIRVDANGAWDSGQTALEAIERLRRFRISAIEQPTPKEDLNALQEVADFCPEPIIADESLCSMQDALKLAQSRACDIFNVRISKCGGIFRSLDIIKIAHDNEMSFQIGCLVGESGLLSAAGRHLASVAGEPIYMEGSYSRLLLKEDVIEEDLTPARSIGYALNGDGLGVTVREDVIRKYSKENILVE